MAGNVSKVQYQVLTPWAEADPVPLKGISPRLVSLAGKKIGIFRNFKQAARPMAVVVAQKLRERFPGIETTIYESDGGNVNEIETEFKDKFVEWTKGIDAAVALVGN